MVRVLGVENGVFDGSGLIHVLGMVALSISIMSLLIFACADHASGRPRNRRGRTGGAGCGGGG